MQSRAIVGGTLAFQLKPAAGMVTEVTDPRHISADSMDSWPWMFIFAPIVLVVE